MNIKPAMRAAAALLVWGSAANAVKAQTGVPQSNQIDYLYNDESHFFLSFSRDNHDSVLVCDAETAKLYTATSVMPAPARDRGKLVGTMRNDKLIYLAYPTGAAMDVGDQMNTLRLTLPERINVKNCANKAFHL